MSQDEVPVIPFDGDTNFERRKYEEKVTSLRQEVDSLRQEVEAGRIKMAAMRKEGEEKLGK